MTGSVRLFVYGSLKQGRRHHGQLAGAARLGEATTAPGYRLVLQGEYPALCRGGSEVVTGELYAVDAEHLLRLDVFEGCPDLYQRAEIPLSDATTAVAYVIDASRGHGLTPVPGGNW